MSDIQSDPQFTVFLDDLEANGAENSDSYSDISVSSVHTCDLTDFDEDSSENDSDRCAQSKCKPVTAVRHHSGFGLTFSRISHIKDWIVL